jgi:hypothetical protein
MYIIVETYIIPVRTRRLQKLLLSLNMVADFILQYLLLTKLKVFTTDLWLAGTLQSLNSSTFNLPQASEHEGPTRTYVLCNYLCSAVVVLYLF